MVRNKRRSIRFHAVGKPEQHGIRTASTQIKMHDEYRAPRLYKKADRQSIRSSYKKHPHTKAARDKHPVESSDAHPLHQKKGGAEAPQKEIPAGGTHPLQVQEWYADSP